MTTARQILEDASRQIGVLALGEVLTSEEANQGLRTLNRMLSLWSNKKLLVFNVAIEEFTLVSGTNSYTLGSGATFNTTVPIHISAAFIKDSAGNELPARLTFDSKEWGRVSVKSSTSQYPTLIYIDKDFPNNTVYLYPTPGAANTLILHNWRQLSSVATLTTALSFPEGYEELIMYALAQRLCPEYGKVFTQDLRILLNDAMSTIKRANMKIVQIGVDKALVNGGSTGWDYRTGELV